MAAMTRSSRAGSAVFAMSTPVVAAVALLTMGIAPGPAVAAPGVGQTAPATWGGCERFVSDTYLPAAQCTTVPVPFDDANPAGFADKNRKRDPGDGPSSLHHR